MAYLPKLYPITTKEGNIYQVRVQHDNDRQTYVGAIHGVPIHRMMDGSYRGVIIGIGEANTPHDAAKNAGANLEARRAAGDPMDNALVSEGLRTTVGAIKYLGVVSAHPLTGPESKDMGF